MSSRRSRRKRMIQSSTMNQPALVKPCVTGSAAKQKHLPTFITDDHNMDNHAEPYDWTESTNKECKRQKLKVCYSYSSVDGMECSSPFLRPKGLFYSVL